VEEYADIDGGVVAAGGAVALIPPPDTVATAVAATAATASPVTTVEAMPPTAASPAVTEAAPASVATLRPRPTLVAATPYPTETVPPTSTPDPFQATGAPALLEIPAIGVSAAIEHVGLTARREMDVPKGWMNVGWYQPGFYPGEPGNAVIAGHLDATGGGPAIFWDLDKLVPGDEVIVTYGNGDRYTFAVQGRQTYAHDTKDPAIMGSIFGSSLTPDLNLITCDGAWNRGHATYSDRLVVFTTLLPEKTVLAPGADVAE
jgi:sortase (surface protein transpeptidase)